jgi:hypothetical protein
LRHGIDLIARFTRSQLIPETGVALAPASFYLGWTLDGFVALYY